MPAPVRMTYLGITSIPKPMIEAGESFGATKRQLLWKVELPAAMPSIMAGLTQCIMLSLSMVVFATLIGAPSLGNPVYKALSTRNIPVGLEAGLAIVVLAIAGVAGTADPEMVLPTVLLKRLPTGLRGITLAALLAAFMSTRQSVIVVIPFLVALTNPGIRLWAVMVWAEMAS
jgi:ABC-type Fe3+ transport system permease subunit